MKKNKTFLAALILGLIISLGSVSSFAGNKLNTDDDNLDYRAWALYFTAANSAVTPETDKEAARTFSIYMISADRWDTNY